MVHFQADEVSDNEDTTCQGTSRHYDSTKNQLAVLEWYICQGCFERRLLLLLFIREKYAQGGEIKFNVDSR